MYPISEMYENYIALNSDGFRTDIYIFHLEAKNETLISIKYYDRRRVSVSEI